MDGLNLEFTGSRVSLECCVVALLLGLNSFPRLRLLS